MCCMALKDFLANLFHSGSSASFLISVAIRSMSSAWRRNTSARAEWYLFSLRTMEMASCISEISSACFIDARSVSSLGGGKHDLQPETVHAAVD